MAAPEPTPIHRRHDAPPPNRPYVAVTPVYWVGWSVILIALLFTWLTFNGFTAIAAICAFVGIVFTNPGLLRAGSVARLDRWALRWAQLQRSRRYRRWQKIDAGLLQIERLLILLLLAGVLCLVASPLTDVVSVNAATILTYAGIGLCILPFALSVPIVIARAGWEQYKADEATGPMEFYGISQVADFIEQHPTLSAEVRLWAPVLAVLFAIVAVLTSLV